MTMEHVRKKSRELRDKVSEFALDYSIFKNDWQIGSRGCEGDILLNSCYILMDAILIFIDETSKDVYQEVRI